MKNKIKKILNRIRNFVQRLKNKNRDPYIYR